MAALLGLIIKLGRLGRGVNGLKFGITQVRFEMKAWPVWCHIVCRKCAATTAGQFNYNVMNRPTMRNEALRNGWRIVANDWLCLTCINGELDVYNQSKYAGSGKGADS